MKKMLLMTVALICAMQVSAQTAKVDDKEIVGTWLMESMQWDGEKKTVCGKETLTRDGKVVVMPHEYGTYTFKDGWYSEMGREAIKDAIVWVDKNTMKGTWKKRHDIWKKTDLPDETVKYILERCKILEIPQNVEQQIKSTCFK